MDLVLIHSGVTDAGEWDALRPLLEPEHRVVTAELPGYGSTPLEPGEFSLADVVLAAFDGAGALVGTSFGARAALEAALEASDRATALVLVSANPFAWSEEVRRISEQEDALFEAGRLDEAAELMVRAWLVGPRREPEEVDETLRERVQAMQRKAYELQEDVDASVRRVELPLGDVRAPTLVVRGELDWPDVERAAARLAAEIPDAREVVLEGCAHLPALERPELLAREILDFLGGVQH